MRPRIVSIICLLTILCSCTAIISQEPEAKEKQAPKTAAELHADSMKRKLGKTVPAPKTDRKADSPHAEKKGAGEEPALPKLTPFEIQDQQKPKQKILLAPDKTVARPLEQAKQLIERERVPDAVQLIGGILEGNDDFFLEPDNDADRLTRKTLKQAAEELLLSLPEEGRRIYSMQYEPLAARLLKNAVESGSPDRIEKIADGYFHTEAGLDAAFLLAMYQNDQGARASAVLTFRRIAKAAPSLDPYEPTFSLTYAACEHLLGHEKEAREILDAFLRRNPNPRLRLGGEEFWNPTTSDEILAKFQSWSAPPDIARWIEQSGWLTSGGIPTQNPDVEASPPLLELVWKLRTISQPKLLSMFRLIEGQMRQNRTVFLPTARPVVVDETLVLRANEGLVGVNWKNGKRVWLGKDYVYKSTVFGTTSAASPYYQQQAAQWAMGLLRLSLWHDTAMGGLSSDGRLLFSLEEEPGLNFNQGVAAVFLQQGKQVEDPRAKFSSTLAARDARTGEVVWRVGKAVLVQKQIDQIEEQIKEENEKQIEDGSNQFGVPMPAGVVPRQGLGVPLGLQLRPRVVRGPQLPVVPAVPVLLPVPAPAEIPADIADPAPPKTDADPFADEIQEDVKPEEPQKTEQLPDTEEIPADKSDVPPAPVGLSVAFPTFRLLDTLLLWDGEEETPKDIETESEEDAANAETDTEEESTPATKIVITPEEQLLGETYFLGPPLPALGNLYVLGENGGTIRLFILDSRTGRLVRHVGLLEPSTPIDSDWMRRRRGSTPAYSEGIVVCPTGAGALFSLDATSGKLLWCYVYSDQPKENDEDQMMRRRFGQMGGLPYNFGGTNDEFLYMIDYVGWAIPATILVDGKLIFAPTDRPMLYCFDLLSGELLWKRSKGKGRYVACVHEKKVIVVTDRSLVALDLETGDSLWDDAAIAPLPARNPPQSFAQMWYSPMNVSRSSDPFQDEKDQEASVDSADESGLPRVAFPKGLSPGGVGVRFGKEYMIPMSDQSVLVVDLEAARVLRSWKSLDETKIGNLVAIGGRVFSQSATEVSCFHQFDTLRNWAEKTLQSDPDNPDATLQLGRLAYARGNRDEAIELFRKSFETKPTSQNRESLRMVLTEALHDDFAKYRVSLDQIDRLKDAPDSIAPLLNAYAQGCLRVGDYPQFSLSFRKILDMDRDYRILHKTASGNQMRLSWWIGEQVQKYEKEPQLAEFIQTLAREEFDRIEKQTGNNASGGAGQADLYRQWTKYIEHFSTHPLAKIAREKRIELLESQRKTTELEFLAEIRGNDLLPILGGPPSVKDRYLNEIAEAASAAQAEGTQTSFQSEIFDWESPTAREWNRTNAQGKLQILLDSEPSDRLFTTKSDDESSPTRPNDAETKKRKDSSNDLTPMQNAMLLHRLAQRFEKSGDLPDAFFFYRLLGTRYADLELSVAEAPDKPETGRTLFERILGETKFDPIALAKKWPEGQFDTKNIVSEEEEKFRTEYIEEVGGVLSGYNYGYNIRLVSGSIYVGGAGSPFFQDCTFHLVGDSRTHEQLVVCRDAAGRKQWTVRIPFDEMDEADAGPQLQLLGNVGNDYTYSQIQTGYLFVYRHVVYYVRGKRLVAIDTLNRNKAGEPTVLWTRTNQSPFGAMRVFRTAISVSFADGYRYNVYQEGNAFVHPLAVHPRVLCFQDLETLYGVDPLTGEVLWTRDSLTFQSYLTCDEESIFQIRALEEKIVFNPRSMSGFSKQYEILALDPETGEVKASGKLPSVGPITCFGSSFVCSRMVRQNRGELNIEVYDLNDFLTPVSPQTQAKNRPASTETNRRELRLRALSTNPETLEKGNLELSRSEAKPIFNSKLLTQQATFGFAENGRVLFVLTQAGDLQICDLAERQTLVSSVRLPLNFGGASGNQYRPIQQLHDLHLEFDDDGFLVILIVDNNIHSNAYVSGRNSAQRMSNRSYLPGYPARGIGLGAVLRYDRNAKPVWDQPVVINNWQFLDSPRVSPVLLFGALIQENMNHSNNSPVIWGLNKKTGNRDFSKQFVFDQSRQRVRYMQPWVKVFVDPEQEILTFLTPEWTDVGAYRPPASEESRALEADETESDDDEASGTKKPKPNRTGGPIPTLLRSLQKNSPLKPMEELFDTEILEEFMD